MLVSLTNNSIEVYAFDEPRRITSSKMPESRQLYAVDQHGHRNDVRTLALSPEGELLASASKGKPNTCETIQEHVNDVYSM
jgi:hypothetical protein